MGRRWLSLTADRMPALGKLLSAMRTLHAWFRLLSKPFRSGDPETEARAAGAELEIVETRRDAQLEAQRRDLTR